eukprot:COSAG05_NODE_2011_length_3702_cov_3.111019_3_plen_156_part_00
MSPCSDNDSSEGSEESEEEENAASSEEEESHGKPSRSSLTHHSHTRTQLSSLTHHSRLAVCYRCLPRVVLGWWRWMGADDASGAETVPARGWEPLPEPTNYDLAAELELGKVDVLVHPCYRKRRLMTTLEAKEMMNFTVQEAYLLLLTCPLPSVL